MTEQTNTAIQEAAEAKLTTPPQPSSQQEIRDLTKEQRIKVADWLCENPKCSIIDAVKYGMALSATPSRTDSEAVDFQDWIDLHGYYHTTSNDKAWFREDGEGVAGTTAELYSIFLTTGLSHHEEKDLENMQQSESPSTIEEGKSAEDIANECALKEGYGPQAVSVRRVAIAAMSEYASSLQSQLDKAKEEIGKLNENFFTPDQIREIQESAYQAGLKAGGENF